MYRSAEIETALTRKVLWGCHQCHHAERQKYWEVECDDSVSWEKRHLGATEYINIHDPLTLRRQVNIVIVIAWLGYMLKKDVHKHIEEEDKKTYR